jgi:alpha-tubulin suppressor-like RCC1 family protein
VDLRSDPLACGDCDNACDDGQVCVDGKCEGECTGSRPLLCDGTCVNPASDPHFCGSCDVACADGQVCSDGRCVDSCDGLSATECSGLCVDTASDPSFCGSCGVHCNPGAVCSGGQCAASCLDESLTQCGDACVDLSTNPAHCGKCQNACAAGQFCSDGKCTKTCGGDTPLLCGGQCLSTEDAATCGLTCFGSTPDRCGDGCFDLKSDPRHCGSCNEVCATGKACVDSKCTDVCPAKQPDLCEDGCFDFANDSKHCGSCDNACPIGQACIASECKPVCPANQPDLCEDGCFDFTDDPQHCGSCDNACAPGKVCANSECVSACPADKPAVCDGSCIDTQNDAENCGGCGVTCEGYQLCKGAQCTARVIDISARVNHTCLVLSDGQVGCFGYNGYGQLGNPDFQEYAWGRTLAKNLGGKAVQIETTYNTSFALLDTGEVRAWGSNYNGELAADMTLLPFTRSPITIASLPVSIRTISAGGYHVCALGSDDTVWCWGWNASQQLGFPSVNYEVLTPTQITGLTGPIGALVAGIYHTCVRSTEPGGAVTCWGYNPEGQVGQPTLYGYYAATPVVALPPAGDGVDIAHSLAAGDVHACAIAGEGDVYCWGANYNYQLGVETAPATAGEPVLVPGLPLPAVSVFAGGYFSCAVLSDESLWCWGDHNGTGTTMPVPGVAKVLDGPVTGGDAGNYAGFAIQGDGTVMSWGESNNSEYLGRLNIEPYKPAPCCGDW